MIPALRSCVYEGHLAHARTRPIQHRFTYPVWYLCLDLDELPALDHELRLFSHNRRNLVALHDRDHAFAGTRGLKATVVDFLAQHGVATDARWRFVLLTHARVLGYVFNPVTFTYCHGPDGELECVVAEVRNTFGKVHRYLLDERARVEVPVGRGVAYDADKLLHVSPFFDLELGYRFHFRERGERLELAMDVTPPAADLIFHARLTGTRHPLDDRTLARLCLRYPLSTLHTVAAIHWQALVLWLRGATFHPEPAYDPELARRRHDGPEPLARAARRGDPARGPHRREAGAQAGTGRPRPAP